MHTTNLRKVGGSVMLAVPPALLDLLQLSAGATVGLAIDHGCLVVNPRPRPNYSLDALLAQCNSLATATTEDHQWLSGPAVGGESL